MKDLTAKQVEKLLTKDGRHRVAKHLYIHVNGSNRRYLVRFQNPATGKPSEAAAGDAMTTSLDAAKDKRDTIMKLVAQGVSPSAAKRGKAPGDAGLTFEQAAEEYARLKDDWGSHHREAFLRYAKQAAFAGLPVASITAADVTAAIKPKWSTAPVAAKHCLMAWRGVFDMVRGRELRIDNPAEWAVQKWHLAKRKHVTVHHPAVAHADMPAFIKALRELQAKHLPALALELLILTGVRSGELLGATWSEVDFDAKLWKIPGDRMKGGIDHAVPLSQRAVEILKAQHAVKVSEFVWQSPVKKGPLAEGAMFHFLRWNMGKKGVTVHGFRSTLRDWLHSETDCPFEVGENILSHVIGNEATRAYLRTAATGKARVYLDRWSAFISGEATPGGNVLPFSTAAVQAAS